MLENNINYILKFNLKSYSFFSLEGFLIQYDNLVHQMIINSNLNILFY